MVLKILMINKVDVSMEDQSTETNKQTRKGKKKKKNLYKQKFYKNYRESATIMGTERQLSQL